MNKELLKEPEVGVEDANICIVEPEKLELPEDIEDLPSQECPSFIDEEPEEEDHD